MPVRMMRFLYCTVTVVALNWTVHPASHSCPTDIKDIAWSAGTIWTCLADKGSSGMSNLALCVDVMTDPFGFWMLVGFDVGRLLMTCASMEQK